MDLVSPSGAARSANLLPYVEFLTCASLRSGGQHPGLGLRPRTALTSGSPARFLPSVTAVIYISVWEAEPCYFKESVTYFCPSGSLMCEKCPLPARTRSFPSVLRAGSCRWTLSLRRCENILHLRRLIAAFAALFFFPPAVPNASPPPRSPAPGPSHSCVVKQKAALTCFRWGTRQKAHVKTTSISGSKLKKKKKKRPCCCCSHRCCGCCCCGCVTQPSIFP